MLLALIPKSPTAGFCEGLADVEGALRRRPSSLVIDVGAYDGADAVKFASAGHKVISIEATPAKKHAILKRISRSSHADRITFLLAAASRQSGNVTFTTFGKGSMQDQIRPHGWTANSHEVQVPAVTLDSVVGPTAHVLYAKIDAQGHDGAVVLGARGLIATQRLQFISLEVSPRLATNTSEYVEALALLLAHGYACMDCSHGWTPHPTVYSVRQADWAPRKSSRTVEARLAELARNAPCDRIASGCWTNVACGLAESRWSFT